MHMISPCLLTLTLTHTHSLSTSLPHSHTHTLSLSRPLSLHLSLSFPLTLLPQFILTGQTASTHAKWLTDANIDYVAVDITNWPDVNEPTDIGVLRPTEVLFEEWLKLRQQGIPTPKIALWVCSPANSTTWQYLLKKLYNNASYQDLIYTQGGKKVFFLPYRPGTCYDAEEEAKIRANFGRNDVTTTKMWALFGPSDYAEGVWGFFSPCVSGITNDYTTSMVGEAACNQYPTTEARSNGMAVEVTASGSYMLSQSALPFASPGHMRGLTLHRLFQRVLKDRPPHVFLSSFNEHIGGRQAPASPAKIAFNMGLPTDPQRTSVWVDTYGSEFSRDVEPTVEGGSRVFEVLKACLVLYKGGRDCTAAPTSLCCTTGDKAIWSNAWAVTNPSSGDSLVTVDRQELQALVHEGWREVCSPIVGPSVFCVNTSNPDGRSGPFLLYSKQQAGSKPLYRCYDAASGHHAISDDAQCTGLGHTESLLGFAAAGPGGETLRALRRCRTPSGAYTHALDLPCDVNDSHVLGFVR